MIKKINYFFSKVNFQLRNIWNNHPIAIWTLTILITILITIYFLPDEKKRDLTHTIRERIKIFKPNQFSSLKLYYDSILIKSDLTYLNMLIWNNGDLTIDSQDVYSPLTIQTVDRSKIFEAKIIDKSRDVINVHIDTSLISIGKIRLYWKTLEKNDGCIIQILYEGDEKKQFVVNAEIREQRQVNEIDSVAIPWGLNNQITKSDSVKIPWTE